MTIGTQPKPASAMNTFVGLPGATPSAASSTTFFHSGVPPGVDPAYSRRKDVRVGLAGNRTVEAGGGLRTGDAIC
jgi:hypothetical protein